MNDPIAVANKQNCWSIDYAQINALYKDFVPQKELSAEQKYFSSSFIPSDKNSNATPSIPASMPSESPLIIELDKIKNGFQKLSELIQKNCKRASIFYTSPEEIQLNDFCQDQLKPIVNELQFYFEFFKTLFQRDIKEMKDVFESTENNSLHAEIEQLKKKSIEIQEGLQARIKILEKDVQRCEKARMNDASSVRRPMNIDSHVKNSVLANSKKPAKKLAVYVRKNKQNYINIWKNVILNKENVIDVAVANASKAKTLLCVSCVQNVLIPCHDNYFANYKLNVHSNVRRNLSTKSRTPKSYDTTYIVHKTSFFKESTLFKSLDTTYVVSKSKIDVRSTSKDNDKVVQIVLWIVDSGCSKHMTGDRSLLKNFVEKFMGIVRFGNDNFAAIIGYGDYIQGNITIYHVYYVEGLGHNLFSVG
ncbi:hypothetical protein Tco_1054156 [Tanacetum coccineum]|uniref:Retrovirus-related Pol polyprotein from transposon TNT 1-94-like beta-barrel domain-containing protein n=1 Tax=Tanacetum coccineum TaxID=301880 RepID=A0ABQ5GX06_9ASTR